MAPPTRSTRKRLNRDLLLIAVPAALVVIGAFALTLLLMRPAPPSEIALATGTADGTYHAIGTRYRELLEHHGVSVRLVPTQGAADNFKRLKDPASGIDVALVQSGIAGDERNAEGIVSLGSLYYEPLWVFHRGTQRVTRLLALRGKMIAIGAGDSGTAVLATRMLRSNGMLDPPTTVLNLGGRAAADLLLSGGIDAAFFMGDPGSPLIHELIRAPGVHLMSFERADAYVRQHPYLHRLTLPDGVFDLQRDIPDRDIVLLGARANLFAREDLHPALAYLLLRAASEVHGHSTLFTGPRAFPAPGDTEVPLSPEARRYYQSGPPFLQRYLPYWAANLTDRLLVLLLPALAVLFPVVKLLPMLYRWRVSSRIYRWYGKLKEIELQLEERRTQDELYGMLARLDDIEEAVNHIETPLAYSENLYVFRQHIDLVRQRAQLRIGRLSATPPGTEQAQPVTGP
jgi:TRAP transporter TAXI family solute receptor